MKTVVSLYSIVLLSLILSAPIAAQQPELDQSTFPDGHVAAVFAGGCFWCMEHPYDAVDGVIATISGYTGGTVANPTYRQVTRGNTGHYEAVLVVYDPGVVSYEELLDVFWVNIDPLDAGGQFCDRGASYRTALFYGDAEQRRLAEASRRALDESGRLGAPVVTEILSASEFYVAEEFHQDYYLKNPIRYRTYRTGCGRDARLRQLWGADAPY